MHGMEGTSLVMGSFNPREEWITRALESCEGFLEVILVDDGSDTPIRGAIRHDTNKGFYEARNTGTRAARGEWIATLDDDDYFDAKGLAGLHEFIKTTDADIVHFPIRTVGNQTLWGTDSPTIDKFKVNNCIPSGSWYRKSVFEAIGGFQYEPAEDWDFWMRAMKRGFRFRHFPEPVYWHRVHSGSKWAKASHRFNQIREEILERYEQF